MIRDYDLWWLQKDSCSTEKTNSGWHSGGCCAIWVIAKGNMNYLHLNIAEEEWKSIDKSD